MHNEYCIARHIDSVRPSGGKVPFTSFFRLLIDTIYCALRHQFNQRAEFYCFASI